MKYFSMLYKTNVIKLFSITSEGIWCAFHEHIFMFTNIFADIFCSLSIYTANLGMQKSYMS